MEGVYSSNAISMSSSQQYSFCKTALPASAAAVQSTHSSGVEEEQEQSSPVQDVSNILSSCNTLQVISVEKKQLTPPGARSFTFPPFSAAIASQAFVFQEPDPPQTI